MTCLRLRVFADIGQRFLRDAEDDGFILGREAATRPAALENGLEAGTLGKGFHLCLQTREPAQVVENGRSQVGDQVAQLLQSPGVQILQLDELLCRQLGIAC
jgi:hypothetical protein